MKNAATHHTRPLINMAPNRSTSARGIAIIKLFEGFRPAKYMDSAGLPTIGYGTLIDSPAEQYLMKATITKAQATALLQKDLKRYEAAINKYVRVPLNQNQFDALASFVYNVGTGNFIKSTLLKLINAGAPQKRIFDEFRKWNKAKGKKLSGLLKRRTKEALLFMVPERKKIARAALLYLLAVVVAAVYGYRKIKYKK